ncbi:hypothetical protein [Vibrio paucivorans]
MSLVEQIAWLAGTRVTASRQVGRSRVFECEYAPLLTSERVKQFIGEVNPTVMRTSLGVVESIRIGRDVMCWKTGA